MTALLIVVLAFSIVFVLSVVTLARRKTSHRVLWSVLCVVSGLLSLPVMSGMWALVDYFSPSHLLELRLPASSRIVGSAASVEFRLPKGRYRVVAIRRGPRVEGGKEGRVRYRVEVPEQGLTITQEEILTDH